MKAVLIQNVDGDFIKSTFDTEHLIPAMEIRGYAFAGQHSSRHTRAELQGQPKFAGLNGPMWDGDGIRYECPAAYERLSA